MTNLEMIEIYKEFCKHSKFEEPGIIPRINSEEDTLGDILSIIYGQAFRKGKDQGLNEGYHYYNKD